MLNPRRDRIRRIAGDQTADIILPTGLTEDDVRDLCNSVKRVIVSVHREVREDGSSLWTVYTQPVTAKPRFLAFLKIWS